MKVPIGILFVNESDPNSLKAIFTMREVAKTSSLVHFVYSSSDALRTKKESFGIKWSEEPAFVINNQQTGVYLPLPKGKPVTFANLRGMVDGYMTLDWNVKKFHLPDDEYPEQKLFEKMEKLNPDQIDSQSYDKIIVQFDSSKLDQYTQALIQLYDKAADRFLASKIKSVKVFAWDIKEGKLSNIKFQAPSATFIAAGSDS